MNITFIPLSEFRPRMEALRQEKGMDFLRDIIGMDWGEEGIGAIYMLENSTTKENIAVATRTTDRENTIIPTVSDIWQIANMYEREVFDFFGVVFSGHPFMRRLYLRNDWVGYPLRKDYDESEALNPVRMFSEKNEEDYLHTLSPDGTITTTLDNSFDDKEYVINIGPQHPATHGVLRFRLSLEGEFIRKVDVHCGYIHRGIEKISEKYTYPQILALTDRLDYLSAHQNRHALCMCIEKAMGLEITERTQYIRTIMDELQRIDSHLLFVSCAAMDLGALTAFIYGFRDREKLLDIFEEVTGGRLIQNYNTIGGVQADITSGFAGKVKEYCRYILDKLQEYNDVFTNNTITRKRMIDVGILSKDDAISYGCTGGTGRASGWSCDVRKRHPYALYDKVDFKEVLYSKGDCYDRLRLRIDEIKESVKIINQLIDNIPEGDYKVKTKPSIRIPEASYHAAVEGSRGEFGVFIESRGEKSPYRIKFRPMGLPLVASMHTLLKGCKIADLMAIGATLDYVIPDIDR